MIAETAAMTPIETAHCQFGALLRPPAGSPNTMKMLRPSTTMPASSPWLTVTTCAVSNQPSGRTKTIVIVKIGWITATRPRSSAIAWRIQPGIAVRSRRAT